MKRLQLLMPSVKHDSTDTSLELATHEAQPRAASHCHRSVWKAVSGVGSAPAREETARTTLASHLTSCMRSGMKWGSQIRSIVVPFSEARGPTHARHLAATLYRNEDYFFQIDSHSPSDRHATCRQLYHRPTCPD